VSNDLSKEFFERDLTEAEENQLAEQISASPESAMQFADRAQAAYKATGLPKPNWNGTSHHVGKSILGSSLLLRGFLACALVGGAAWWLTSQSKTPSVSVSSQVAPAVVESTNQVVVEEEVAQPIAAAEEIAPVEALKPPGMVKPQAYSSNRKYEGLNVIVSQEKAGLVTVRVLDENHKEVRLLYAGMIQPGDWTFTWEGRAENGAAATPGVYLVETQSGRTVLQKRVQLDQE